MSSASEPYDAVGLAIMWDRLVSIADEIVSTLVRTSFSTIVSESYDLTVAVLDRDGNLMVQGTYSIPVFMGTAPRTLRYMLEKFPPETLRPGDIVVTNDPWMGTGHIFDISVMRPVFRGGEIVAYTMSITHLPDVGGLGFGAGAREIYHEGLRLPICKLVREGVLDEFLIELIRTNVRTPEQVIGDIMANVTCNEVGDRYLREFMDEYRLDGLSPLSAAIRGHSEQATRDKIGEIANGVYRNTIQIEGVDSAMTLACRIDVHDDSIDVDLAGTGPCVPQGINVPFCYTNAMVLYAIKCLTAPHQPNNGGSAAPIRASAPEGCLLHALPPYPTGGRHAVGHYVAPLVFGALAKAAPEKVQADCGMTDLMTFHGTHRDGRTIAALFMAAGGFGALSDRDGAETLPGPSNMAVVPVEVWESLTSTTVERKVLLPDTGGAGQYRGGVGQEIVVRNDSGSPMDVFAMGNCTEFPPQGFDGGKAGRLREHYINGASVPGKGHHVLSVGDRFVMRQAGGGGYGDPALRAAAAVLRDVQLGLVSVESALRDYGVAVSADGSAAERAAGAAEAD